MILLYLFSRNANNPLNVLTRLSDQTLHQMTLWSIVLGIVGFLYFSSDLLAKPNGILRSALQLIFPVMICGLPFLLIAFISRYIPIPWVNYWVLPTALMCTILAGGVGLFHSLFAPDPAKAQQDQQHQQDQPVAKSKKKFLARLKNFPLRGFLRGFFLGGLGTGFYSLFVTLVLFQLGAFNDIIPAWFQIFLITGIFGGVLGCIWHGWFLPPEERNFHFRDGLKQLLKPITRTMTGITKITRTIRIQHPTRASEGEHSATGQPRQPDHFLDSTAKWLTRGPKEPTPPQWTGLQTHFLRKQARRGLLFWLIIAALFFRLLQVGVGLSILGTVTSGEPPNVALPDIMQNELLPLLLFAGVFAVLVLSGWFASGIASLTYWVAHNANAKRIANLGLVISLLAFSTQLIEPLATQISPLLGHSSLVALSWSPTGDYIASVMDDGTVQIWNPGDGSTTAVYHDPTGKVSSIAWDPDYNLIASADKLGNIHLWQANLGDNDKNPFTLSAPSQSPPQAEVRAMAWSSDGNYLAIARQGDSTVQVFDFTQGYADPKSTLFNYSTCLITKKSDSSDSDVNTLTWFNGSNPAIIVGANDGTITGCSWNGSDAAGGAPVILHIGAGSPVNYLYCKSDGSIIANEGNDMLGNNVTLVWSPNAVYQPPVLPPLSYPTDFATAWSPDGSSYAAINSNHDPETVYIEPLKTKKTATGLSLETLALRVFAQVTIVAWSTDGVYVATGSSDGTVQVWIVSNGSHLSTHKFKG